jgi:hypothetical protein
MRKIRKDRKDLLIGSKMHNFTILENIYGNKNGSEVKVKCECGKIYTLRKQALKSGEVKRCMKCASKDRQLNLRKGIGEMSGSYFRSLIRGAKSRNIGFNITKEEIYNLFLKQNKKCALTGIYLILDNYKLSSGTASLDRIDSSKGYEINNVQWIHKDLNKLKNNLTIEKLLYWAKLINEYNK